MSYEGECLGYGLTPKDISVVIRSYVKRQYPTCKFSVTCRDYHCITVALMEAPFSPWYDMESESTQRRVALYRERFPEYEPGCEAERGYMQVNQYQADRDWRLSDEARAIFQDIYNFSCKYNYDRSDAMRDYHDVGFYLHLAVGKWDKRFTQKAR